MTKIRKAVTKIKKEQLADNVTLYCGDCREILPTLGKVDCVVSDPPYGIEELIGGKYWGGLTIANDKNLDCVTQVFHLIKQKFNNVWIVAFYSCRISPTFFKSAAMFDYFGEKIWDKKNLGLGNAIRYQHENIAFFMLGKPEPLESGPSVLTYMRPNQKEVVHPHEKPVQVMHNICSVVPGKIILDPFMGTGSTGVAAVQLKRGFVGVELDPKYFDYARKRISDALKQPTAFWE